MNIILIYFRLEFNQRLDDRLIKVSLIQLNLSQNDKIYNLLGEIYKVLGNEKLSDEDVNFVEKEFNDLMLTDGYEDLFRFPIFKEFIKSINDENN